MSTGETTSSTAQGGFSAILERAGERFNPLLVKECRQSLKSRQFSTTFTLVVVLSWLWSIYGIVLLGPDVSYQADGAEMFYGYYLILAFPLLLIVPYSAFRSLIAEREDNTFELVAITTLRPRQIVAGKLGSAMAQMIVYLSVAAPCLAFTYLLRGIDVLTICWILFYTVLASLGFSLAAILLATLAKERHWQVMVSVLLIVGLFNAFIGCVELCYGILRVNSLPFQSLDFWVGNLQVQTAFWSSFALVYLAAGAQLTPATENRSTALRAVMLIQQVLLGAWVGFEVGSMMQLDASLGAATIRQAALIYTAVSTMYWFGAGSLMLGEATELSSRAKRSLPSSFLGRVLTTWFNPGPDTGYMFCASNGIAAVGLSLIGLWIAEGSGVGARHGLLSWEDEVAVLTLPVGYLVIYLGAGNVLLHLMRKVTRVTIATSTLIVLLILACGVGIPHFIRYVIDYRSSAYSLLHISDPFWTCVAALDQHYLAMYRNEMCWIVLPIAAGVLLLNLLMTVPALRQVRIARPARVEEAETAMRRALPDSAPASPWNA